jgi:glucose/arabinose dehydrogenase
MRRSLFLFAPALLAVGLIAARAPRIAPAPPGCDPGNGGLTLPDGFCASVFASLPGVRNLAVAPNGDLFAAAEGRGNGGVFVLRDADHDGHADTTARFATGSGTGIAIGRNAIFFGQTGQVLRYAWTPGALAPSGQGTTVVSGLPTGGHGWKTLALAPDGGLFVDHGSGSNTCQLRDRSGRSPGQDPCPELAVRAGIWRYDASGTDQQPSVGLRWATGIRNGEAIAVNPSTGRLWGAIHGRDQLGDWGFSSEDNAEKPAEEFGPIDKGADYGWPYCYFDPILKKKVLAPEYGGDGVQQGQCAQKTQPAIGFPGHWAPMQLAFVPMTTTLGSAYAGGAFLAFHGSWNRAPLPQAGYRVVFIPFRNGSPTGSYTTFAFIRGREMSWRASGVAVSPDGGALYIGSDGDGKIWRVVHQPGGE